MKRFILLVGIVMFTFSLFGQDQVMEEVLADANVFPVITFIQDTINLGSVKKGELVTAKFDFVNTGDIALDIELVTACKCTSLSWPQDPVRPNGAGSIFVTFDSTDFEGEIFKVVDIIANTDPIVVEGFFKVNVIR